MENKNFNAICAFGLGAAANMAVLAQKEQTNRDVVLVAAFSTITVIAIARIYDKISATFAKVTVGAVTLGAAAFSFIKWGSGEVTNKGYLDVAFVVREILGLDLGPAVEQKVDLSLCTAKEVVEIAESGSKLYSPVELQEGLERARFTVGSDPFLSARIIKALKELGVEMAEYSTSLADFAGGKVAWSDKN